MKKFRTYIIFAFLLAAGIGGYMIAASLLLQRDQPRSFLTVHASTGKDRVVVDGKSLGDTPLLNSTLMPGMHTLTITKDTAAGKYFTFQTKLLFQEKTNTFLLIKLGPSKSYTEYILLSLYKSSGVSGLEIIDDNTIPVTAHINNQQIETGVLQKQSPGNYTLTVTAQGYLPLTEGITIQKGYILSVEVHLFRKPF